MPRSLSARTIQFFGIANLAFAALGLLFGVTPALGVLGRGLEKLTSIRHTREALAVMIVINLGFLAVLILAGIRLMRVRLSAVTLCNIHFPTEILYFSFPVLLWNFFGVRGSIAQAVVVAYGVGNMGIGAQIFTGYPVIALVALNLARRKLMRASSAAPRSLGNF
jgi:hypothetical protein